MNDATIKAGCILLDKVKGTIALVYREKQKDFSFPKGHLEAGETIEECAIRETAEETKRIAEIVKDIPPFEERYGTPWGEKCIVYIYVALDKGKSDNTCEDTHPTHFIKIDDVERTLTYESQRKMWRELKGKVLELMKK